MTFRRGDRRLVAGTGIKAKADLGANNPLELVKYAARQTGHVEIHVEQAAPNRRRLEG